MGEIQEPAIGSAGRSGARAPRSAPSSRFASMTVPPPRGRGIVLALIGAVALYALVNAFVGGGGSDDRRDRGPVLPLEAPPDSAPALPRPPPEPPPPPPPAPTPPAGEAPIPAGLPEGTARRLRLAVSAVRHPPPGLGAAEARVIASAGIRELPAIAAEAEEPHRAAVRGFVLERLAEFAREERFAPDAWDAAVLTAPRGEEAGLLVTVAAQALGRDATTPAALLFLSTLPDRGGAAASGPVSELILDAERPLLLRILAARTLDPAARAEVARRAAEGDTIPEPLRDALR
jgi:hypothetical protein